MIRFTINFLHEEIKTVHEYVNGGIFVNVYTIYIIVEDFFGQSSYVNGFGTFISFLELHTHRVQIELH